MVSLQIFVLLIAINFELILGNLWSGERRLHQGYLLYWKTDDTNKELIFRVEVMTKGWVSFGFSKHGKTTEADVVIGWVDDTGRHTFKDFWVNEFGSRSLDTSQDWHLISGTENASHTSLEFKRNYITCDSENDLEIFQNDYEMSNIVFAYSFIDPQNVENISSPVLEAVLHLNLFIDENEFEPKETDLVQHNYWMNFTLPAKEETKIICQLMKNDAPFKHMIVKFKTEIIPATHVTNHHSELFRCKKEKDLDIKLMNNHIGKTFPCYDYSGEHKYLREKCSKIVINPAIKSTDALSFPESAGITIDPDTHPYWLLEGHIISEYDYPKNISFVIRTWITRQFREHEAEYLPFGAASGLSIDNWGFILPPKVPAFKVVAVLDTYCLDMDHLERGIHIFANVYHTHNGKFPVNSLNGNFLFDQGQSMEIRHYRNDRMLRSLQYNHYDSEYQPFRPVRPPINLRKGDKIVVICEYNTSDKSKTIMNPSEHCVFVNYYYPKINTKGEEGFTYSKMTYETMLKFSGLQRIDGFDQMRNQMIIREPAKYNNTKLIDFVAENKYELKDPVQLEELLMSADMDQCCNMQVRSPCEKIKPPPDLYKTVVNKPVQNSCIDSSVKQSSEPKVARSHYQSDIQWIESFKGLKFSLKIFYQLF